MANSILVIDDERPTLSMFQRFLVAYGFDDIHVAENGAKGLEIFAEKRPPIVLTDIKMPGMDGIEVLTRIKEMDPATEVIVITGHGDMDMAIKALNLDATDFINKPIQRRDLEAALRRARERIQIARSKTEEIVVMDEAGVGVVDIQGNLTSKSDRVLVDIFGQTKAHRAVVLIFNEHASVNGAGIALLTQFFLDCQKRGQKLAMAGLSDNFQRVFALVGLDKLAPVHPSRDEAIASVRS
ncbi:MAG: response regulator [Deltaproteobacteria bacterium]|nr:response regulator [Deltaproteobacteria bacterium]